MSRKIVITSGKGGVGKTTIAGNLGAYLGMKGKRTCVVDADFGLNNLDLVAGVENSVVYDAIDCIEGRCRTKQALIQSPYCKNTYFLPAVSSTSDVETDARSVKDLVDGLSEYFDYIIIDSPAGINHGFHIAVNCADEAIVVSTPQLASLRDADKVLSKLKNYKIDNVKLLLNRMRGDLVMDGLCLSHKEISSTLKVNLIGVIPDDDRMFLDSAGNLPGNAESAKAFRLLAQSVISGKVKLYNYTKDYSGFIGSIKRGIKRSI